MKKLSLILISLFGLVSITMAQQTNTVKAVISTPTIQCEMCKKKIQNYVSRQNGIKSVVVNLKNKTTTVTWIPDSTNIEEVKASIASVGYDADDVKADEEAYKKLPACCKMQEHEMQMGKEKPKNLDEKP